MSQAFNFSSDNSLEMILTKMLNVYPLNNLIWREKIAKTPLLYTI